MDLQHIDLSNLKPASINVRKKGGEELSDLIPSIRSLGILQPLLVRPNCEGFEIVAGQRRFRALTALAEEAEVAPDPVPCIVMTDGDDAKAIEASLAENVARLPMDEIDQYKAFSALIKEGQTSEDIAAQFGVTERLVNQRLAIANLYGPILNAYRRDEVDARSMRVLTMATIKQQKAWWKLHKSKDDYAPTGHRLKDWLFGGDAIPASNAIFDVEASKLALIGDLFGADSYFADGEAFWTQQNMAIAEKAQSYRDDGWQSVVVHDVGHRFQSWNYVDLAETKGGEVHITVSSDGEVNIHEGVMDRDALRKQQKAEAGETAKPPKPEITKAMQNYLGLHRHASVRSHIMANSCVALRLIAAHMLAGSNLWAVKAEPQRTGNSATNESLAANKAQQRFENERIAIKALLGIEDEEPLVNHGSVYWGGRDLIASFTKLLTLEDDAILRILAFLMAETLEAHSALVETVGTHLETNPMRDWSPDEAFIDLLRDKEVINAMLGELAGEAVAKGNLTATANVQKGILKDCLSGEREANIENWQPRYMAFPMGAYTERGAGVVVAAKDDTALTGIDASAEKQAA